MPVKTSGRDRTGAGIVILAALLATLPLPGAAPAAAETPVTGIRTPTAAPDRPAPPRRIALGDTEVQFTWPAIAGASGYRIRLTSGGQVLREQDWSATNVFIDGLTPETTYDFSVAAVNSSGTGAYSAPVRFTTPFDFVERQFGLDRFATAARVSSRAYQAQGAASAFITDGTTFPDALSAAAAAGRAGAPVLLTRPTSLREPTRQELTRLGADRAFIAGGDGAVNGDVQRRIAEITTGGVIRLAGPDRYATAAAASTLWGSAATVYLASGLDFPDALAGAAAAGSKDSPVLLTRGDSLPDETARALARLRPAKIVVLGGTGVISDAVVESAVAATGVSTATQRLGGINRYMTAIAVSKATFPTAGVPAVYIASGLSFPDALAGAAAAGHRGGPVLLTGQSALPTAVLDEIRRLKPQRVILLGGPAVISDTAIAQLLPLGP
ncbi:cell wall-binding repeat-containing protein [Microbacterium sp.]|uniref:cell wall-binding repeat-containing protein n=1 Tax=Microbacterium sp. TaxID=51671 RepID=UPI0028B0967A|nr:cell wall-binding repeat-containing protein [Microbacterium sp.]